MAIDQDLELMLRVRGGDAQSFEVLLHRHRSPLVNFFRRMLRDPALAEDLAQEVFLRVYQARERYEADAKFTTWLYRIATNLALNALRDRKDANACAVGMPWPPRKNSSSASGRKSSLSFLRTSARKPERPIPNGGG